MSATPTRATISVPASIALVVASMVGTGVFTSLGFQLSDIDSGAAILFLWLLGGVLSLCGAFCYAELGCMMPRSGGEYHLLAQMYHPLFGFMAGWISVIAGFAAPIAASAIIFGTFLEQMWPWIDPVTPALIIIGVIFVIQLCHLRWIERFQMSFSTMKILLIFGFMLAAYFLNHADWSRIQPRESDLQYFGEKTYAAALVWVMYAYMGWNGAIYFAGDITHPQQNLPKTLLIGTGIVMLLYLAINAAFLVSTPWEEMKGKEYVALVAAKHLFGETGRMLMGTLICLGLIAHISAMLFFGSRVLRTMGEDTHLLKSMKRDNRFGAPANSVIVLTLMVLGLMFTGSYEQLLMYVQALLLLCSLFAVLGVIWLRYRRPDAPRPFRVPYYPLPPLLFCAVTCWMLFALLKTHPYECAWGAITLVIGAGCFYVLKPNITWKQDH